MKKLRALFVIGVAMMFLGTGCMRLAASKIPKDFSIQFESGACFGSCPVYKLSASANGAATYEGISFVTTKGIQKVTLSLQQIYALKQKVDHVGFFTLNDGYITDETGDLPRYKLTVTDAGRKKSIIYNSETELEDLQALLVASIRPEQWIAATPERCLEEYPSLRSNLEICRADLVSGNKNKQELFSTISTYRLEQSVLKKIVALKNEDLRSIWLTFLNHSENVNIPPILEDFDHQNGPFMVSRKLKNKTGKLTLNIISEAVTEKQSFARGYFVTDTGGAILDSYLIDSDWNHAVLSNVSWKGSLTVCFDPVNISIESELQKQECRSMKF